MCNFRSLALLDLAVDSKLHGCNLVYLKVGELVFNDSACKRFSVIQSKTNRPAQFEVSETASKKGDMSGEGFAFAQSTGLPILSFEWRR